MTVTINEESMDINPETGEENPNFVYDDKDEGKQVGEFEIEIGTQKTDDGEVKVPNNADDLVDIIKANVEHNCNKMLQFCSELLAKEFNKKITDLEAQITNLTDDNKMLLEDNKKYKTQIENSMTNIRDHFTITYDTDNS